MLSVLNPMSLTNNLTTTLTIGLTWGGVLCTSILILILSFKEVISVSKYYNKPLELSIDTTIYPFLFVFFLIVVFKTLEVLYP